MSFPNRRAENCSVCHVLVEPGQGYAMKSDAGGRWMVKCKPCSGVVADAKPAVAVAFDGASREQVTVTPKAYLGGDHFDAYRGATMGGRYDSVRRCQVVALGALPKVLIALHGAGFVVDLAADVADAVQGQSAATHAALRAAYERADEVDAALRARGMYLYGFQRMGIAWLAARAAQRLGALQLDDMGLGKTLQAMASVPAGAPMLVVCPSVAKGVWKREAARWRPDLRVTVLNGLGSFRWPEPGELVILNWAILPETDDEIVGEAFAFEARRGAIVSGLALKAPAVVACDDDAAAGCDAAPLPCALPATRPADAGAAIGEAGTCAGRHTRCLRALKVPELPVPVPAAPKGTFVVADEAHAACHRQAARTQRLDALAKAARESAGAVILMTATPLMNKATELWTLLGIAGVAREAFGGFEGFAAMMGGHKGRFGWEWYSVREPEAVAERLRRVSLRRTKVEVLADLPAKRRERTVVDLDAAGRIAVDKTLDGVDIEAAVAASRAGNPTAFRQVSRARAALATAKIPALLELVEQCEDAGEPVLVFSAHVKPCEVLGKREGWATITGATSPEERTTIEERFQRGELRGIAGTIDACGVAITLTRANRAIFIDQEWNPALNSQAEDRIYRIGQKRSVLITVLVADHPLDERIADLLAWKGDVVAASVEASRTTAPTVAVYDADIAAITAAAAAERARTEEARLLAEERAKNAPPPPVVAGGASGASGDGTGPKRRRVPRRPAKLADAPDAPRTMPRSDEPTDAQKAWAAAGLLQLAADDPDRAREKNGVGFSAGSAGVGHWLAYQIEAGAGLTEMQWRAAIELCRYHRRQVGPCPEAPAAPASDDDAEPVKAAA